MSTAFGKRLCDADRARLERLLLIGVRAEGNENNNGEQRGEAPVSM